MTYEEMLGVMLGLIGRRVEVGVLLPGHPDTPGLACVSGVLSTGEDMGERLRELGHHVDAETIMFTFAGRWPGGDHFHLDPERFIDARWESDVEFEIDLVAGVQLRVTDWTKIDEQAAEAKEE